MTEAIIRFYPLEQPDLLYPYYREGYFPGIPEGLSNSAFHDLISSAMSFMTLKVAYCNGELIAVFELRPRPYKDSYAHEAHTIWFTESKRKRAITLQDFVKNHDKLVTFVPRDESGGHFAMVRRGMAEFMGEYENAHVFEVR